MVKSSVEKKYMQKRLFIYINKYVNKQASND